MRAGPARSIVAAALSTALAASTTPSGSPTVVVGPVVDASTAVVFPIEDVVGPVEDLIFAEATEDGAVTDRGGREFILASDVLFAFDKATLTSRARAEIARIGRALQAEARAGSAATKVDTVTVDGYTDSVGSDAYNLALSRRRATAVRAELVTVLGRSVTVRAAGRGERDPVSDNDTERGRQLNRRVEIRGT